MLNFNRLLSRIETESSAHLDKRSKQHHVSWNSRFDLHSPTAVHVVFENHIAMFFDYTKRILSKEACLYADDDWLSSSVSQRLARASSVNLVT